MSVALVESYVTSRLENAERFVKIPIAISATHLFFPTLVVVGGILCVLAFLSMSVLGALGYGREQCHWSKIFTVIGPLKILYNDNH